MTKRELERGSQVLVRTCADLRPHESAFVISDSSTSELGAAIENECRAVGAVVTHRIIPSLPMHGAEPPTDVAAMMATTSVIFGITKMSMAHSQARLQASRNGARYLSLPDYSTSVFQRPALFANYRDITGQARRLADLLTDAREILVTSERGTRIRMSARGRVGNCAPGWCDGPGSLASPPDAEANVAVVEDCSEGVIVVDGSIPHPQFGVINEPLRLIVEKGRVTRIEGERSKDLSALFDSIGNSATRVIAEFGIGLNPLAELCGSMLEDEGVLGTVHFGIGSNATVGGLNSVPFHLDHVVRMPSVRVDDIRIMERGVLQ